MTIRLMCLSADLRLGALLKSKVIADTPLSQFIRFSIDLKISEWVATLSPATMKPLGISLFALEERLDWGRLILLYKDNIRDNVRSMNV